MHHDTMTTRDRFRAVMNFQPFDRLPLMEWAGWWNLTIDRWHEEGLPKDITDGQEIRRHFGQDLHVQGWLRMHKDGMPSPASHGAGVVANEADYDRVREFLFPWPVIEPETWTDIAAQQQAGDVAVWFTLNGYFWHPRTLLGIEGHFYALYDQPRLVQRMNQDMVDWQLRVIEELYKYCTPDFMSFAEDMSYNHGPMLSKDQFAQFLTPYYRQVLPAMQKHGTVTIVDSDGDITVPAAWFADAGVEGILPLERQAGVDVNEVRRLHPDMRFIGCFDKMVMNRGEAAIRTEFERLLPSAGQGGLIISCDHQTPPGVSYQDYLLYMRLFREYAEQAGRMSQQTA